MYEDMTDVRSARSATKLQSEAIEECTQLGKAIRNDSDEVKTLAVKNNQLLITQSDLIATLCSTYANFFQQLQNTLPPQIERQQPVIFEDAHGKLAPFSVEFINSFAAFQAVLEVRFADVPGLKKVKSLQYVMQDTMSKKALDVSRPWESIYRPGRKVVMSIMFHQVAWSSYAVLSCPGCLMEVEDFLRFAFQEKDTDMQWYVYLLVYPSC